MLLELTDIERELARIIATAMPGKPHEAPEEQDEPEGEPDGEPQEPPST